MPAPASSQVFLAGFQFRPVLVLDDYPFAPRGMVVPSVPQTVELIVADARCRPGEADLRRAWSAHSRGRAFPVLLAVLHGTEASICGPAGGAHSACATLDRPRAEGLCRAALESGDWARVFALLQSVVEPVLAAPDPRAAAEPARPGASPQADRSGELRSALLELKEFLLGQSHVLRVRPQLLFQQAANQPDVTAPAVLATRRSEARLEPRPWFRSLNKPRGRDVCIATLAGHAGEVTACALSPDARWLVSASRDATLRIWDVATGRARALEGHGAAVHSCAFSPDGRWIVSASADHTLRLWETASGESRAVLRGHQDAVNAAGFSPDGAWIVSGSSDRTLRLWPAGSWDAEVALLGHTGPVTTCAFSPDGRWIATGSADRTVRLWNVVRREEHATLRTHDLPVTACRFSPDGRWVLSAAGAVLKLTSPETEWKRSMRVPRGSVLACALSPDTRWLALAMAEQTVVVWDTGNEAARFALRGHHGEVTTCAFSPDGRLLATGSRDHTLKLWLVERIPLCGSPEEQRPVGVSAVSLDGNRIATASADAVTLWNVTGDIAPPNLTGHQGSVTALAFAPDGWALVSAAEDKTLKVWRSGLEQATLRGHRGPVSCCAFSPDGRWIASGSQDHTVKTWDARSWRQVASLEGHDGPVNAVAFSADGGLVLSGSVDGTLRLWARDTGPASAVFRGHAGPVTACAFSPDYHGILSASADHTLKLWDVARAKERATLRGHRGTLRFCSYSADARWILSAADDETVIVWDAGSLAVQATFPNPGGAAAAAFSPDGACVALATRDAVCLWDCERGAERGRFLTAGRAVAICWSPAGSLVIGTDAGAVHLLRVENLGGRTPATAWGEPGKWRRPSWLGGQASDTVHFGCPHCRRWSESGRSELGRDTSCPRCGAALRLSPFTVQADWESVAAGWAD